MRAGAVPRQVRRRHAERISLDLERRAPAGERIARQRVDLAHLFVGHGVAAARGAVAMDHEKAAVAAVRLVEGIRKAGVDRQIVA